MQHVFIIGSKGIPAAYGGYETFVDKLTEYHQNYSDLKYHIACKGHKKEDTIYNGARCFYIRTPKIGPAQAIYYDIKALKLCCEYIRLNKIAHPIIYVLACRIGPFFYRYVKKIHKLGGLVYVNPDGHEWKRAKWPWIVRKYWKHSERLMVKHADLLVCDSKNIENYIRENYKKYNPSTVFLAYGAELRKSQLSDNDTTFLNWLQEHDLKSKNYYLVVGRFVPENNYETMIKEFMKSKTKKDFALITNVSEKFMKNLKRRTGFDKDKRIKFVGTVYDKELLMKIREHAFAYFHGHEVGGTNPSLLEALASTDINLLLDVGFNREVAEDGALYWTKENSNLAELIDSLESLSSEQQNFLSESAKSRISGDYSWEHISNQYYKLFSEGHFESL